MPAPTSPSPNPYRANNCWSRPASLWPQAGSPGCAYLLRRVTRRRQPPATAPVRMSLTTPRPPDPPGRHPPSRPNSRGVNIRRCSRRRAENRVAVCNQPSPTATRAHSRRSAPRSWCIGTTSVPLVTGGSARVVRAARPARCRCRRPGGGRAGGRGGWRGHAPGRCSGRRAPRPSRRCPTAAAGRWPTAAPGARRRLAGCRARWHRPV
jgi:hypothetical protein